MKKYANNEEFFDLLVKYKKNKDKKVFDKVCRIFLKISKNLQYKPSWINYTDDIKSEMESDAIFYMIKYVDKYDIHYGTRTGKKNNPFSYFTMIAINAFRMRINKFHKTAAMFVRMSNMSGLEDSDLSSDREYSGKYVVVQDNKLEGFFQ